MNKNNDQEEVKDEAPNLQKNTPVKTNEGENDKTADKEIKILGKSLKDLGAGVKLPKFGFGKNNY